MFNFFKSKKKVSLMDFHNQVGEIAIKYGKDHWNTRVEVTEHRDRQVSFDAYIPSLGWVMGKPTVKDVLDYFKERIEYMKEPHPVKEVLI